MKHRKAVVVGAAALALLVVAAAAGIYFYRHGGNALRTITRSGGPNSSEANTISIYAPNQLSKSLQLVTTAFQQERPGTTFQFTLGTTDQLAKRIVGGQQPTLYIDSSYAIAYLPAKIKPKTPPVPFGYDIVQLAVKRGNPKKVTGLDAFAAGSAFNAGVCAPALPCGNADAQVLQRAGVNAAPRVVSTNPQELTDGVTAGTIDAILVMRTDLRAAITGITSPPLPPNAGFRVDYQIAQFQTGSRAAEFVQWLQSSPTARQGLRMGGMLSFYDL